MIGPRKIKMPSGTGRYNKMEEKSTSFLCFEIFVEPRDCSGTRDQSRCLVPASRRHISRGSVTSSASRWRHDSLVPRRVLRVTPAPLHTLTLLGFPPACSSLPLVTLLFHASCELSMICIV